VGLGGPRQDAPFDLRASVPAGTYHVVCDAVITGTDPIDVAFSLIWRRGGTDMPLAQWMKRWEPLPGGVYTAQAYEVDMTAAAIAFQSGDQFVFRYEAINPTAYQQFIPNGDGPFSQGRIPNITLPP
jgi:hypothetical protein